MRLICPNCGAQYEVADDVIPTAGRDVQCSNCGHTWFETPGGSEAAEAGIDLPPPGIAVPEPALTAEMAPDVTSPKPEEFVWADDEADGTLPDMSIPVGAIADDAESAVPETVLAKPTPPEPADDTDEDDDARLSAAIAAATGAITPVAPARQRREISPEVAEILQEEAAREEARRSANTRATLENQPDLGLDAGNAQQSDEIRRRTSGMRGETVVGVDLTAPRRDLLPDIEEINSTLRATTQRAEQPDATAVNGGERRRGFRFGFGTVVLVALIAAAVYIAAPRLAEAIPAIAGVLGAYVDAVDQARLWLDLKMQQILVQMNPPTDAAAN